MFLHRALAAIAMLLVLWTAIRARTDPERRDVLIRLSTTALVLFAAQILVGAANVWTRLQPWAVVVPALLIIALTMVSSLLVDAAMENRTPPRKGRRP